MQMLVNFNIHKIVFNLQRLALSISCNSRHVFLYIRIVVIMYISILHAPTTVETKGLAWDEHR